MSNQASSMATVTDSSSGASLSGVPRTKLSVYLPKQVSDELLRLQSSDRGEVCGGALWGRRRGSIVQVVELGGYYDANIWGNWFDQGAQECRRTLQAEAQEREEARAGENHLEFVGIWGADSPLKNIEGENSAANSLSFPEELILLTHSGGKAEGIRPWHRVGESWIEDALTPGT